MSEQSGGAVRCALSPAQIGERRGRRHPRPPVAAAIDFRSFIRRSEPVFGGGVREDHERRSPRIVPFGS